MRRAVLVVVSTIALLVLPLASLAVVEAEESGTAPAEETAFGEGEWDGLLLAAVVAVVFGIGVFVLSGGHRKDEDEEHGAPQQADQRS